MLESVIAGIISAILFAGLVFMLKELAWPRIQGKLERVPDISGKWEIFNPEDESHRQGVGECIQRGTKVTLKYLINERRDKTPSGREFTAKGHFHSGQLVLTYEEDRNKGYIVGAIVLKLDSKGTRLTGKVVFFDHDTGKFEATDGLAKKVLS